MMMGKPTMVIKKIGGPNGGMPGLPMDGIMGILQSFIGDAIIGGMEKKPVHASKRPSPPGTPMMMNSRPTGPIQGPKPQGPGPARPCPFKTSSLPQPVVMEILRSFAPSGPSKAPSSPLKALIAPTRALPKAPVAQKAPSGPKMGGLSMFDLIKLAEDSV